MLLIGRLSLILALVFSLSAVVFLMLGVRQRSRDLIRNGYLAVYAFFITVVVASAVLLSAFVGRNFSFAYVAENSNDTLSVFYRIAGFWAGQQGSFLLWLLFLAVVTAVIALRNLEDSDRLTASAVGVLAAVSAFFAVLMNFDPGSNPFLKAEAGAVGQGLNPLLLHPAMVLHPPALFLGYTGLAVPFAFATATLLLGRADRDWVGDSQKWTIAGWAFLSLGIGLGAWWAYVVLSWGGYWGWDPVENTSLIPWLTATALLHSMNLYRKRGIFKHWTLALATGTFWLTIVATWTTRTGLINSVHAFGRNQTLIVILSSLLAVVAALSIGLIAWRWRRFESNEQFDALFSRDFLFYLTNVVLSVLALAVLFSTVVVPLVMNRTVGPTTYNLFARPLGVVVVLALAVCPLFAWGRTDGRTFWRNARWPLLVAVLAAPLLLLTGDWRGDPFGLIGLEVCIFAAAAVVEFVTLTARRAAGEQGLLTGLRRAVGGSRTRSAAYLAHIGIVLVLAGLIGSNVYKIETSAYIPAEAGATAAISGYTLKFTRYSTATGPQDSQRTFAHFDVYREGRRIGTLAPHTDVFTTAGAADRAVILGSPGQDLFVVAQDPFDTSSKNLRLQLDIFPLIKLVWAGAILLVVGAGVSLWPKRERATVAIAEPGEALGEGA
jgi:cytochrome c-type biogenesis protein CcmF